MSDKLRKVWVFSRVHNHLSIQCGRMTSWQCIAALPLPLSFPRAIICMIGLDDDAER